jgi:hypothetical protein
MSESTMRGMRLGSQSLENEVGVNFAERQNYEYKCGNGHTTSLVFAADADVPEFWQCRQCSEEAALITNGKYQELEVVHNRPGRSHWEMLLERRTKEELEEILQERIEYVRARRAKGSAEI